ncbi:hypothetical protein [Variovorax terrae]|nr:hypothetical protein [Variovorax terrae]
MALHWKCSLDGLDWNELSALYRAAPRGNKSASGLALERGLITDA